MNPFALFRKESTTADAARGRARERTAQARSRQADWSLVRTEERRQDRVLSPTALAWLERIPQRVRPATTATAYPRIVNRIALCWTDAHLTECLFDEMMVDRRGKRRGFPPDVVRELLALREYTAFQRPDEDRPDAGRSDPWDSRLQATSDR